MDIRYENLNNKIINNKKHFFDINKKCFYMYLNKNYRYFIEARRYNEEIKDYEFYILISDKKFDNSCRLCETDDYGRVRIRFKNDILDYMINESNDNRINFNVTLIEKSTNYDIYLIS